MSSAIIPKVISFENGDLNFSGTKQEQTISTKHFQNQKEEDSSGKVYTSNFINTQDNKLLNGYCSPSLKMNHNDEIQISKMFKKKENLPVYSLEILLPASLISSHSEKNCFKTEINLKNESESKSKKNNMYEDDIIPEEPSSNHIENHHKTVYIGGLNTPKVNNFNRKREEVLVSKKNGNEKFLIIYEVIQEDSLLAPVVNTLKIIKNEEEDHLSLNLLHPNPLNAKFNQLDSVKRRKNEVHSFIESNNNSLYTPEASNHKKGLSSISDSTPLSNLSNSRINQINLARKELLRITLNEFL